MDMLSSGTVALRNSQDVAKCRQTVGHVAQHVGFEVLGRTMMVTAASELARNAVIHGGGGELKWEVLSRGGSVSIRLTFTDHGPGIADLKRALTAGWSSGAGLGLGLTGSKRLSHEFIIDSAPGKGTRVSIVRWREGVVQRRVGHA
jgi:serine/threonine-protein kinase RsbT